MPIALNTDRLPDSDAGRFFRKLMTQWPQGLWLVKADGTVIGHHYHRVQPGESYRDGQQRWVRDTLTLLDKTGPQIARPVPTTDPFPDRGVGSTADGGVRMAVSVVGLRNGRRDGPPAVDSVHLTAAEWAAFARPPGKKEWTFAAPAFAPALSPLTDSIFVPKPDAVTTAELAGDVVRDEAKIVVRYRGKWTARFNRDGDPKFPIRSDATGNGVGLFDVTGRPVRMIWLIAGRYDNGTKQEFRSIVEWRSEK